MYYSLVKIDKKNKRKKESLRSKESKKESVISRERKKETYWKIKMSYRIKERKRKVT